MKTYKKEQKLNPIFSPFIYFSDRWDYTEDNSLRGRGRVSIRNSWNYGFISIDVENEILHRVEEEYESIKKGPFESKSISKRKMNKLGISKKSIVYLRRWLGLLTCETFFQLNFRLKNISSLALKNYTEKGGKSCQKTI